MPQGTWPQLLETAGAGEMVGKEVRCAWVCRRPLPGSLCPVLSGLQLEHKLHFENLIKPFPSLAPLGPMALCGSESPCNCLTQARSGSTGVGALRSRCVLPLGGAWRWGGAVPGACLSAHRVSAWPCFPQSLKCPYHLARARCSAFWSWLLHWCFLCER